MPEGFYLDEHISRAVANALRQRGYQVVRSVEVDMKGKDDDLEHLPYATEHRLVLVTFDHPFANRTAKRDDFLALVCLSHTIENNIGRIVMLLDEFMQLFDPERDTSQVFWLG